MRAARIGFRVQGSDPRVQGSGFRIESKRRRGFTLLEVMLALGMSVMVMITLYMSVNIGLRGREIANESLDPVRSANLAIDLARADLESVLPPTNGIMAGPFTGTTQQGSVAGTRADSLEFYSVCGGTAWMMPQTNAGPAGSKTLTASAGSGGANPLDEGVHKINLLVRTDMNPPALVRQVTRDLLGAASRAVEPEEEVLCRGVRSFAIQYVDLTSDVPQDEWSSEDLGVLPAAVIITMEIEYRKKGFPDPQIYRVSRFIPLACAKPDTSTTGGAN